MSVCKYYFSSGDTLRKGKREIINRGMCQYSFPESARINSLLITAFVLYSVNDQKSKSISGQQGRGIKGLLRAISLPDHTF